MKVGCTTRTFCFYSAGLLIHLTTTIKALKGTQRTDNNNIHIR